MGWATRFLVVVSVCVTFGCAQRTARAVTPTRDVADELVRQGCYDCLRDARAEYERRAATSPAAVLRLFEVDLLLALREKELALDPDAALNHAASLVPRLSAVPADRILSVVKALPPDATARRVMPPTAAVQADLAATIGALDASTFSSIFKSYVKLSIQCGRLSADVGAAAPSDDVPLLAYRRAVCENPIRPEPLRAVRTSVPQFVETSFFLGRAAMASLFRTGGREARELFEEAYHRFSNSPAIALDLGSLYQATNDCRRADTLFSRVLELRAGHEEAQLGRAICRTYLSRHEDAIADATVLIDAAASNRGDAYYWRAWNRRRIGQLDAARADINRARTLRYNARILTLAGMIEYDQRDFATAREDLQRARDMDGRECEAPWYLALVEYSADAWAPSAKGFADAADCYDMLVKDSERLKAEMAARTDVAEDFRATVLAGFDAAIAEDSVQRSAAELNAAINYGRAGDLLSATTYMKRAAVDPQRRTAVEDLRQVLGVPRW